MKIKSIKINAILNGIKQCCTIIFPLITIPYASRILGNENYGRINFSSSVVSYFILVAALGIDAYAIREGAQIRDNKTKISKFVNEVFTINIITTIISYIALILVVLYWKKLNDYRLLMTIQAMPILFTTLGTNWINNIYEDFFYTTVRYIAIQLLSVILLFLLVNTREDYLIYAAITAFANIGGNLVNIYYIRKYYVKTIITSRPKLKKHLPPMLYLFGNMLAATIYLNSGVTLLALIKNNSVTGIYSIATKIYIIIKQFIYAIVGVTSPRLAAYLGEKKENEYNILLNKLFHVLFILILPMTAGIAILGKSIIDVIAGKEFVSGYVALLILAIAIFFSVMSYFFSYAIMIPNKLEKYCLLSTVVGACVNLFLNIIFIPIFSLNGAAFSTAVSEALVMLLSAFFSRNFYSLSIKLKKLLPSILGTIGIGIICAFIRLTINNNFLIILLSSILSIIFYTSIMIIMKDQIIYDMLKRVLQKNIKSKCV